MKNFIKDILNEINVEKEQREYVDMAIFEYYLIRTLYPYIFNDWTKKFNEKEYKLIIEELNINEYIINDHLYNQGIKSDTREIVFNYLQNFFFEDIVNYLKDKLNDIYMDNLYETPISIINLAIKLLESKNKGNLLNLCSGKGDFIAESIKSDIAEKFFGVEINEQIFISSALRLNIIENDLISLYRSDVFSPIDILTNQSKITFDKVFCDLPYMFGRKKDNFTAVLGKYKTKNDLPVESKNSADFYFFTLMLRNLSDNGKAIAVTTNGPLINSVDSDIRKYLVKNGLIEMIIELPNNLYYLTTRKTYMIVFSHNNDKIKFVNLSNIVTKKRNLNEIDINKALDLINLKKESKNFTEIKLSDIDDKRYNLLPLSYLQKDFFDFSDSLPISDYAAVFSGWQISRKELDFRYINRLDEIEIKDEEYIGRIIQASDISDGAILNNEKYYKFNETHLKKFQIENNDIAITTKGSHVKVAIANLDDDEIVLASSSVIVIRVDEGAIDPYYLLGFLNSFVGKKLLAQKQTGTVIPNLTVNNVKWINIPNVSYEKQKQLGAKYLDLNLKLIFEKKRIESLENEMDTMFNFVLESDVYE